MRCVICFLLVLLITVPLWCVPRIIILTRSGGGVITDAPWYPPADLTVEYLEWYAERYGEDAALELKQQYIDQLKRALEEYRERIKEALCER